MDEMPASKYFCYNHPQRETLLRCNRCERPICSECAVLTPTGYRCKECVRNQQKIFETATSVDLVIGAVISLVLSFIGSYIASYFGFFALFIAPIAGFVIAEAVRRTVHRRRSKRLFQICMGAAILGSLPLLLLGLLSVLVRLGGGSIFGLLSLVWQGAYTFLVASTVYYRLSGIHFGR
jgi:hypothetical protein